MIYATAAASPKPQPDQLAYATLSGLFACFCLIVVPDGGGRWVERKLWENISE